MRIIFALCAGLEVHKKTVVACRSQPGVGGERLRELRTFGTMTV